jgi:hypothetical protein
MKFSKKSSKNRKITKRTAKRKYRKQSAGFSSDKCETILGSDGNVCEQLSNYDDSQDDINELNELIVNLEAKRDMLIEQNNILKAQLNM